ncbi:hypothetical protein Taro_044938 [Colocasia esculenta]|uniref:Uncharacterized protein n=1 Tax=Colocasia esculenta TaxID=4460 RepID=A0A843WZ90_COLES|nr:hypothetical protein [Colocasia esculenta]
MLVPERHRGVRHGAAAQPGCGGACVVFFVVVHWPHSSGEVVGRSRWLASRGVAAWWHRCVCSLTSWHVRGPGWFCLWALNLVEVHAEGCFRIVSDSIVSAGVVSGLTLVVGRGITLFRCFVVLYSRVVCFRFSLEFLLLWLVRDWLSLLSLVREAHPPTFFR